MKSFFGPCVAKSKLKLKIIAKKDRTDHESFDYSDRIAISSQQKECSSGLRATL